MVWFGVCGMGGDAPVRLRCNVCARGRSRHMSDDASPRATRFHAKSSSMRHRVLPYVDEPRTRWTTACPVVCSFLSCLSTWRIYVRHSCAAWTAWMLGCLTIVGRTRARRRPRFRRTRALGDATFCDVISGRELTRVVMYCRGVGHGLVWCLWYGW